MGEGVFLVRGLLRTKSDVMLCSPVGFVESSQKGRARMHASLYTDAARPPPSFPEESFAIFSEEGEIVLPF